VSHFVIKSIVNKQTFKEIGRHHISKSDKIALAVILSGALAVAIGSAANGQHIISFYAILFVAIFPFVYYLTVKKGVKLQLQRISESTGSDELELEISFNDDKIAIFCTNTNGTSFIEYTSIDRFVKTKNMYVLLTKARQFIAIDKTAFAESEERKNFFRFLKSKACKI